MKPSPEALQLVKSLMEQPDNSICADCKKKAAKWASSTLGVFICIDCSGIHRSLGTHISFVRSCTLDSWTPDQARLMRKVGNKIGNEYWEARLPRDFIRPASGDRFGMEAFIRAKYIERRWAAPGEPPQNRSSTSHQSGVRPSVNMYEGYFQHNPMQQQQQAQSHYIMGQRPLTPSKSIDGFKQKQNSGPQRFMANPSQQEAQKTNKSPSMNLVDFMNQMNAHTENQQQTQPPPSEDDTPSSFSFMNEDNSNITNSPVEVNTDNPFGPSGEIQLPPQQPVSTSFKTPQQQQQQQQQQIPPHYQPQTIQSNIQQQQQHSQSSQNKASKPESPKSQPLSTPTAQEIMQAGQPQKITCVGKKKQSLFGKKSKAASRFAKKPGQPAPPDSNYVVDQMLNISESTYRPVSAPVHQQPPPQIQRFVPNTSQQQNYMMNYAQQQYQPQYQQQYQQPGYPY
ncbi:hypothetical protein TRFO_02923 [Tritrichomonas foetus]|uniref:Arf-GAP domain-containing protein n=1 Tax=Tritrichomonas foetus TaxID=1144522 RepID=A0A1J4L0T7_9EUKA|nr:hypothetical protein TRFO_02923 [Tritrichomonas foetus]|eukprot:OHT15572.1 hypothetical protein TRFO_02923 [Tritrichomonas foetus]